MKLSRGKQVVREKGDKVAGRGARRGSISRISKMPPMSARQTVLHAARLFICGRARNWAIVAKERSRGERERSIEYSLGREKKEFQFRLRGAATRRHTWRPHPALRWNIGRHRAGHKSASGVGANYGSLPAGKKRLYVRRREQARRILWINLRPCARKMRLFGLWR